MEDVVNIIIDVVADYYHVKKEDIQSPERKSEVILPRQVSMYLCRDMLNIPLEMIGKALGDRDYTTVRCGVDKIKRYCEASEGMQDTLESLKSMADGKILSKREKICKKIVK